jgi:hypothetical protein
MTFTRLAIPAALLALALGTATSDGRTAGSGGIRGGVKFYLDVRYAQQSAQGTFATSGAFTDSGTFTTYYAGNAGYGKVRVWRRFAGKRGSIVIQDVLSATETGSWTILSGTGAYRRLRGQGTSVGSILGNAVAEILVPTRAVAVATGNVFTAAP